MSSLLRSSKFLRYFASAARGLVNANTRCATETGPLQHISSSPAFIRCLATQSPSTANQYSSNLERSLQQLDQDVRRVGRISRKELEDVLEEIKHTNNATSSQSLLVIRCCGSLIPEELPEVRTKLVQKIWATMEKLKVPMDISHYNALLRVYLENEHNFSPAEFLQNLERKGVEPNRVTYQRLITRYCQEGDIEGATRILEFMREKCLPVNETVFNALIMGHSQGDDMDSAVGILSVMKQAGLEPTADSYTTLLVGYAKRGDAEKIKEILEKCDREEIYLMDKDYLDIVFSLATNGHSALVDDVLARTRKSAGFNQDAVSAILRLINKGYEDVAMKVFRLMPNQVRDEPTSTGPQYQGTFLVKQLVKAQRPVESILSICKTLEEEGLNRKALQMAAESSLQQPNIEIALQIMKSFQEAGNPIRQHYFWPLICTAGKNRNDEQVVQILKAMSEEFGMNPSGETVREYVVPNLTLRDNDMIVTLLRRAGVSSGATASALVLEALQRNALPEAADVASKYRAYYPPDLFRRSLNIAYLQNPSATQNYLDIIHYIYEGAGRQGFVEHEADVSADEKRDLVGAFIIDLLGSARGRPIDLVAVLQGLASRGLGITNEYADRIHAKLSGEHLTNEISELLSQLTGQNLQVTQAVRNRIPDSAFQQDESSVLNRIKKLEQSGQPTEPLKRNLINVYCKGQETDKAIQILQELGSEAGPGSYAFIIDSFRQEGRLDEALDYYRKLRAAHPEALLDPLKIVRLVESLYKADRVQDGLQILEEQNVADKKFEEVPFVLKASAFQALNFLAEKGDEADLQKTFDLFVKNNYVEVTNVLLGPLVKVHVLKNDINKALETLEVLVEKYKMTPWKSELMKRLIDKEDAAALQRVTDISSKAHGEVNSLYDLVFAFVECGRIRQARKILETPGLRNRQSRLSSVCERYQAEGSVAALEGLVEATKDMGHIDRSEIFKQLLSSYIKADDADKALGVWTQMQEEDVQPPESFLITLANFLEKKGVEVPFVKPQVTKQETKTPKSSPTRESKKPDQKSTGTTTSPIVIRFKNALKAKDWFTAQKVKAELDANNVAISKTDLSLYIEGLCQNNMTKEAVELTIKAVEKGDMPNPRVFRFLTNKLCTAGDTDSLKKIGESIDDEAKKLISFDNKLCGAYLNSGKAHVIMDELLAEVEKATPEDMPTLVAKFPRGAASGIIEAHPELLPKFEQIVGKYAQLGSNSPANALWIALFLTPELSDRAAKAWTDYKLSEEPRPMFQRIIARARSSKDLAIVTRLLETLKDSKVTEPALGVVHSCALDVLVANGEPEKALEHLKSGISDISLENFSTSSLVSLKNALQAKGLAFPYTIPPKKSEKQSSSSSSSSDDEKEKKAARE